MRDHLYFVLIPVKITLDWLRMHSYVLEEPGFVNRLQIWPAFCKLINALEPLLKSFPHEKCKFALVTEMEIPIFVF